jgi:GWxTD domain-containing protein
MNFSYLSVRMKRAIFFFLFSMGSLAGQAQALTLQQINYNYLYNPAWPFTFTWKVINHENKIEIYYRLETSPEMQDGSTYSIQWELRKSLSDKEGIALPFADASSTVANDKSGKVVADASTAGQIVVAKVYRSRTNNQVTLTLFHNVIPTAVTPALFLEDFSVLQPFTQLKKPVTVRGFDQGLPFIISIYENDFPAAGPPFSTAQARVPAILKPDTTFVTPPDTTLAFTRKGLYLVQQDTASSSGLAFRIEDDYPKLGKLENLHGPMIYICTRQEYDRLRAAGSDKTQFDKIILSITGNTDRARIFMRSFFRRVEQANTYFSSYKEGWKTDRGMIYIIYGLPEEVYLFGDREVWEYKNAHYRGRFTFVKSSTLFDPENYVLIRDKKFNENWYQMIDLWRKARF